MEPGQKLIWAIGIILAVVFVYILILAMQPATNEMVSTANLSTGNWTADPGFEMAQGVLNSFPLIIWFLPALIGLIFIVWIWRS